MKKFVQINSTINIYVVGDFTYVDGTDYASTAPNKLNIKPLWTNQEIMIKEGQHYYPAAIKNFPAVKSLVNKGILMIGQESDTADDEGMKLYNDLKIAEQSNQKIKDTLASTKAKVARAKKEASEANTSETPAE